MACSRNKVGEGLIPLTQCETLIHFAKEIGIDVIEECHLLWVANNGLCSGLTNSWRAYKDKDGNILYHNESSEEISFCHPSKDDLRKSLKTARENTKKYKHLPGHSHKLEPRHVDFSRFGLPQYPGYDTVSWNEHFSGNIQTSPEICGSLAELCLHKDGPEVCVPEKTQRFPIGRSQSLMNIPDFKKMNVSAITIHPSTNQSVYSVSQQSNDLIKEQAIPKPDDFLEVEVDKRSILPQSGENKPTRSSTPEFSRNLELKWPFSPISEHKPTED